MRKNPIIALAQIRYFDESKKHNVDKIVRFIKKAKKLNADIICFPESCVHKTDTLTLNHHAIKQIREACKNNSIWAIITEDMFINGKSLNTALLIDREGKIRGKYHKIHLYDDGKNVSPGRVVKTFSTDFAKIGIIICWDITFQKLFRKMKKAGAEIVFCPAQWMYEKKFHDEEHRKKELSLLKSLILSRAFENTFFVAICNPIFDDEELISFSAMASPTRIIKQIIGKEGIITAELNLREINNINKIYEKRRIT